MTCTFRACPQNVAGLAGAPKIKALLPCYNAAEFIEPTLECLAAQTWPDLEILIGDDCSSNSTLDIVRCFASKQPNVRVVNSRLKSRLDGKLQRSDVTSTG